ncbi:MAG: hypothetical protein ACI9YB_000873, partial [Halioglobus sp.]
LRSIVKASLCATCAFALAKVAVVDNILGPILFFVYDKSWKKNHWGLAILTKIKKLPIKQKLKTLHLPLGM